MKTELHKHLKKYGQLIVTRTLAVNCLESFASRMKIEGGIDSKTPHGSDLVLFKIAQVVAEYYLDSYKDSNHAEVEEIKKELQEMLRSIEKYLV